MASTSKGSNPIAGKSTTDFSICCLCQHEGSEDIRKPYTKETFHPAYKSLEEDLQKWFDHGVQLPMNVNLKRLDNGSGIASTLLQNQAIYHHSCRSKLRQHYLQRILDKQKEDIEEQSNISPIKQLRSSFSASIDRSRSQCVMCLAYQEDDPNNKIHQCLTSDGGKNLLQMALDAKDWPVHARLNTAVNAADALASDICYHNTCKLLLLDKARLNTSDKPPDITSKLQFDPLVFAELVVYVKDSELPSLKLAELIQLYEQRLLSLNSEFCEKPIHSTRFKNHLLEKLGTSWSAHKKGRDILISHNTSIGDALADSVRSYVSDEEALAIVNVGLILRKYILQDQRPFNGHFEPDCMTAAAPKPLLTLIHVMLEGSKAICKDVEEVEECGEKAACQSKASDIEDQDNTQMETEDSFADLTDSVNDGSENQQGKISKDTQTELSGEKPEPTRNKSTIACTIAHLICSNASKRSRKGIKQVYHIRKRETPTTLYVGLSLHSDARRMKDVKEFHQIGLSVSDKRLMDLRTDMARAVTKQWAEDKVVVPVNVKRKVFVTGADDNYDQNDFHGTVLTLTAHPTNDNPGVDPPLLDLSKLTVNDKVQIPKEYAVIPYAEQWAGDIKLAPIPRGTGIPTGADDPCLMIPELAWLDHVKDVIVQHGGNIQDRPITYSGYFSHIISESDIRPKASIGVYPTLSIKVHLMETQKHCMLTTMKAIEFVNPGQTPVIAGDLQVYMSQKKAQYMYPEEVGEDKIVCFVGMLHLEMAAQECGGVLLAGSGWEQLFITSNVYTSGVAASLLGGKHVKRTRHAYHLTLAWIHILESKAYADYLHETVRNPYDVYESMEAWESRMCKLCPTFCVWITVKHFLLLVCRLVRGQRQGDWPLTLKACFGLGGWFFACSKYNYARWILVFVRNMMCLPITHPDVHTAFTQGLFVVQRSKKKFATMALDQSQEHSVKYLKDGGGTKGLQQDEKEVIEISKPEVLRYLDEFQSNIRSNENESTEHPDSSISEQKKFIKHLNSMLQVVEDGKIANPFDTNEEELITLDTREIMDPEIVNCLKKIEVFGKSLRDEAVTERIELATKPVSDIIPRPCLYTFTNRPPADLSKGHNKISTANANLAMVTTMFMNLQGQPNADMEDFFKHESSRDPPPCLINASFTLAISQNSWTVFQVCQSLV